uniref:Uncharacterized protein n=1 Tax=Arundo donax TaxID=35708 RepID=A0A0A8YDU3_ARUDO
MYLLLLVCAHFHIC